MGCFSDEKKALEEKYMGKIEGKIVLVLFDQSMKQSQRKFVLSRYSDGHLSRVIKARRIGIQKRRYSARQGRRR